MLNPLKWFKRKLQPPTPSRSASQPILKMPAKPRKSGNIFMLLITIQKSLKSIELALRQKIDFTWLMQKTAGQMSVLKLEAETVKEEELAGVAGQVKAYFETVSEGRLDFNEEGLSVISDFVNIFKDAMGDPVSGPGSLDRERLEEWDSRYQALMAQMKPGYEDTLLERDKAGEAESFDEPDLSVAGEEAAASEEGKEAQYVETAPVGEPEEEEITISYQEAIEDDAPVDSPAGEIIFDVSDKVDPEASGEVAGDLTDTIESPHEEEIPLYDPSEEIHVRDVVIPDAEIKSAREYVELGEFRPEFEESEESPDETEAESAAIGSEEISPEPARVKPDWSPVQLQEVERLKEKLFELHEKQESLSSKMTDLLGGFNKAVRADADRQEPVSFEKLDIDDLEDIIFIGRGKG